MTDEQQIALIFVVYAGGLILWVLGFFFLRGAGVLDDPYGGWLPFSVLWPLLLVVVPPFALAYWLGTKARQFQRWRARQK